VIIKRKAIFPGWLAGGHQLDDLVSPRGRMGPAAGLRPSVRTIKDPSLPGFTLKQPKAPGPLLPHDGQRLILPFLVAAKQALADGRLSRSPRRQVIAAGVAGDPAAP